MRKVWKTESTFSHVQLTTFISPTTSTSSTKANVYFFAVVNSLKLNIVKYMIGNVKRRLLPLTKSETEFTVSLQGSQGVGRTSLTKNSETLKLNEGSNQK